MNKFASISAAIFASAGAAFQYGIIPGKYAGYAMVAATLVQALQSSVLKPSAIQAAQIAAQAGTTPGMVQAAHLANSPTA